MPNISNFVDVQITRGIIQVSRRGFGVPLILSASAEVQTVLGTNRTQVFGSLDELIDAGFTTTSEEFLTASTMFSQRFQPEEFIIGRIDPGDATLADSILAVQDENNDWYMLILLDRTEAAVLEVAAFIETQPKYFLTGSNDAAIIDTTGGGDIFEQLMALNYARTGGLFNAASPTTFTEAGWAGRQLPLDPGSTTWALKNLSGVVADPLTQAQFGTVQDKNGNTYTSTLGVASTFEGRSFNGEFIDIIRFTDFLQARIEENVFSALLNNEKIPYTQSGIAQVESPLRAALQEGVRVGGLASPDGIQPAFTISVPDINTIPVADRAARILRNLNFTAFLAGAIHTTEIRGNLTL